MMTDYKTKTGLDLSRLQSLIAGITALPAEAVTLGWTREQAHEAFVVIQLNSVEVYGGAQSEITDDGETITDTLLANLTITSYGNNAMGQMIRVRTMLDSINGREALSQEGQAILMIGGIIQANTALGGDYEERASMTLTVMQEHVIINPDADYTLGASTILVADEQAYTTELVTEATEIP